MNNEYKWTIVKSVNDVPRCKYDMFLLRMQYSLVKSTTKNESTLQT